MAHALARAYRELGRLNHKRPGRVSPRKARRRSHRYDALGDEPASRRVTYEVHLWRLTGHLQTT
jgi:hypothetical protein